MALPPEGERIMASGSGGSAAPKAAAAEGPASGGPEAGPASGGPEAGPSYSSDVCATQTPEGPSGSHYDNETARKGPRVTIDENHPSMEYARRLADQMTPRSARSYMREQLFNANRWTGIRPMGPRFVCPHGVPDLHYHCATCQSQVQYQHPPSVAKPRGHPYSCACSDCLFFAPSLYL